MHYLLTPLHTHVDFGFGRTGDAFKEAADKLEDETKPHRSLGNEHLPVNYLRRHALELYLKSAIVIIHKRLDLPYGAEPASGEPHVLVTGEWRLFQRVHSIRDLWIYLASLFREQKAFFDSVSSVKWSFPVEVDQWIEEIEQLDPRSTFFRYLNPRTPSVDVSKDAMAPGTPEEIMKRLQASHGDGPKQFIVLMENDEGEVKRSYYYAGEPLAGFGKTLKDCLDLFHGLHAAMRSEICGGA